MKTKKELKEYLLKYFVNESGDLDLEGLDFGDFNGDVKISGMKIKGNLFQDNQQVGGLLSQRFHEVEKNLYQYGHEVKGNLWQGSNGEIYEEKA